MNAATLLNELNSRNIALFVVAPDRLRFEARKDSLDDDLISALREHKRTILGFLGKDGSTATRLGRRCPFCRQIGMTIEDSWRGELHYFDTRCASCDEIVETLVTEEVQ